MFKVGDILVGNEHAEHYSITTRGVKVKVIRVSQSTDHDIKVQIVGRKDTFWVNSKCFDLVEPHKTPQEKLMEELGIEDIIFNGRATVIKFTDGDKQVTLNSPDAEEFSPMIGIAMALAFKKFGGRDEFKKFARELYEKQTKK